MDNGADINAVDKNGRTTLSVALERSQLMIAALLIRLGAKMDISWDHSSDHILFELGERKWVQNSPEVDHLSLSKLMAMLARHLEASSNSTFTKWRQYMVFEWELPKVLSEFERASMSTTTLQGSVYDTLLNFVVLTGTSDKFDCSTCGGFLSNKWNDIGLHVLRLISRRLETMMLRTRVTPAGVSDKEVSIPVVVSSMTQSHIAFLLNDPEFDNNSLTEAIQWLCSAVRSLKKEVHSLEGLQRSAVWTTHTSIQGCHVLECSLGKLTSLTATDIGANSCWVRLFRSAVVALWPLSREWGHGLELPFNMLVNLAAVKTRVYFSYDNTKTKGELSNDSRGWVLIGYFTTLLSTGRDASSNSIQWHIEYTDGISDPQELISSRDWLGIQGYASFEKSRCFLGWSDPVDILWGTKLAQYNLEWSGSAEHRTMRRTEGVTIGADLGLGEIHPLNAKLTVEMEYIMHNVVQNFTGPSQYCKAILHLSKQVGLVYDASADRAWFVPLLSLLLHFSHAYFSYFTTEPDREDSIPFANAQSDGARASMNALKDKGDEVVLEGLTLGNILLGIHVNMKKTHATKENLRGRTFFATEAMDQIDEPLGGSPLKSKKLSSESRAWRSLVPFADFVCICGNLGLAMQPQIRDPANRCQCHILPEKRSLLAAHNLCLELMMMKKGVKLEELQNDVWKIEGKEILCMRDWPFTPCAHDPGKPFWSGSIRLLCTEQNSSFGGPHKELPSLPEPPKPTGAVVFGVQRSKVIEKIKNIGR